MRLAFTSPAGALKRNSTCSAIKPPTARRSPAPSSSIARGHARGSVKFDRYHNVIGDVFIRKCERNKGSRSTRWRRFIPNVSEFWTYDKKEFLAAPVYGRDYP